MIPLIKKADRYSLLFIFIWLVFASICALSGIVPLTYDEAWNFTHISSNGPQWVATNYPFPNNHVLFSILQSVLIPKRLVEFWPDFLRIPNLLWSLLLLLTLRHICARNNFNAFYSVLTLLTATLASPLVTTYFFVSRGYMLGLLLLILSVHFLISRQVIWSACFLALAAYTVPTFGFVFPGFALFILLFQRHSISIWKIFGFGICSIGIPIVLYLPILEAVLAQSGTFKPFADLNAFTSAFFIATSSIGEFTITGKYGVLIYLLTTVGLIALWIKKVSFNATLQTSAALLLTSLGAISVVVLGHAFGVMNLPFLRSVIFVPFFMQIAFLFLCVGTIQQRDFLGHPPSIRKVIFLPHYVQIICSIWIFSQCFLVETPIHYPHFSQLTPSPIERAIKNKIIVDQSKLVSTIWNEPVLSLFQKSKNLTIKYEDIASMERGCLTGQFKTPPNQKILKDNNGKLKSICY